MKKIYFTLFILVSATFLLNAQELEKSLLWKVSGHGIDAPSYIFGTFHMLCPDDLAIPDKVQKAMEQSEQLVLELDFDDPEMLMSVQQGMMFRDGTTAMDYLSGEEYNRVADFFINKMELPFAALVGIKPFFLSSMTILYFLDCQPVSMEQKLTEMAEEQGIEIVGLETVEEQLGFVDSIPLEDAAEMLLLSIDDENEMQGMTDEMVAKYLEEDLEGLEDILDRYMEEEYTEINDNLLANRNHDWISKIINLAREQPSFIAFGAGHLTGEEGVIKLLRQEGYDVEPIY